MNPETKIENSACKKALQLYGVRSIKLNIKGNVGWPDRMFLIPGGQPLFIEFKKPGEPPRAVQVARKANLEKLGYKVEIYDNVNDALQEIAKALEATRLSKK